MQSDEKFSSSYSMTSGYNSTSAASNNENTRAKRDTLNNSKLSQNNYSSYSSYVPSSELMASNFMKSSAGNLIYKYKCPTV
jgi:hypothetical protein